MERPQPTEEKPKHLCLDKGYDNPTGHEDGRTTRYPGDAVSQRKRTCVEDILGWMKTVGLLRKTGQRGVSRHVHTILATPTRLVAARNHDLVGTRRALSA